MHRNTSMVCSGILEHEVAPDQSQRILVGSRQWFEWLSNQRSFAFVSDTGRFTSRKEKRPGGWYWYAYRRIGGKLKTAYLGKTEEIYLDRLNRAASLLAVPAAVFTTQQSVAID